MSSRNTGSAWLVCESSVSPVSWSVLHMPGVNMLDPSLWIYVGFSKHRLSCQFRCIFQPSLAIGQQSPYQHKPFRYLKSKWASLRNLKQHRLSWEWKRTEKGDSWWALCYYMCRQARLSSVFVSPTLDPRRPVSWPIKWCLSPLKLHKSDLTQQNNVFACSLQWITILWKENRLGICKFY